MKESVLIIDFGSQVTKLIARRIRELGVFSKIIPYDKVSKKTINQKNIKGVIFSGGPKSVNERNSPRILPFIYDSNIPILGICYGLQLISKNFGGIISPSDDREFGKTNLFSKKNSPLIDGVVDLKKNIKYG